MYAPGPGEFASLVSAYDAAEEKLAKSGLREIDREDLAALVLSLFAYGIEDIDEVVRRAVRRVRSRQAD